MRKDISPTEKFYLLTNNANMPSSKKGKFVSEKHQTVDKSRVPMITSSQGLRETALSEPTLVGGQPGSKTKVSK